MGFGRNSRNSVYIKYRGEERVEVKIRNKLRSRERYKGSIKRKPNKSNNFINISRFYGNLLNLLLNVDIFFLVPLLHMPAILTSEKSSVSDFHFLLFLYKINLKYS